MRAGEQSKGTSPSVALAWIRALARGEGAAGARGTEMGHPGGDSGSNLVRVQYGQGRIGVATVQVD